MKKEVDTLLNLAYIYMNYGKTKRAIDYLLIAYRIDPHNIQVKKMKIAAFRDIGAFSQALEIIKELEARPEVELQDKITLKLMKSFCLKGTDKLEEGRTVFADYLKHRKELATKDFMKKHRKKLLKLSNSNYSSGTINTNKDIDQFVKQAKAR
ncbi:MAG: tetratricopeptide (TPR) repeat protein [Alphaproteobacteria bacterium]|jgi:tetratricopeptide (TPR) repeat protein